MVLSIIHDEDLFFYLAFALIICQETAEKFVEYFHDCYPDTIFWKPLLMMAFEFTNIAGSVLLNTICKPLNETVEKECIVSNAREREKKAEFTNLQKDKKYECM